MSVLIFEGCTAFLTVDSGKLLLCVVPPPGVEALRSVRWHPKKPDTVAVASESHIYLININEASRRFGSDPVAQSDLIQVGPVMSLSSVGRITFFDHCN